MTARYIIGIDLGTTNTAVAYVDTRSAKQSVTVFGVQQLIAPGEVAARSQLPSFVYSAGEHDLTPSQTALPWDTRRRRVVGELARNQGARMPSRMVASAKSWLCHPGVDRQAPILPWGVESDTKLSPIAASALVLSHLREAWDHAHAGDDDAAFCDQELIVTVPASFDEAARELTLSAAHAAGMGDVVLLEEPQAAFYAWIDTHTGRAKKHLKANDLLLVFDIGGGTTDFTLIRVGDDGDSFERTAVGDHLLLGGDNIDLTLAKHIETQLRDTGKLKKLDALQWHGLVHACRLAKESLLTDSDLQSAAVTVAGRGRKLIGGTVCGEITQKQLQATVHDGFFPLVQHSATPHKQRGGLQEFGLPYATDPAITRHLANFLSRHGAQRIDAVLFNGGAMTPASLRKQVVKQIAQWQDDAQPDELANTTPELAVATGAAYYGLVRRGLGSRIRGGTPRAFYVGVGQAPGSTANAEMAVCIAPKRLEEGSSLELKRNFDLVTNRPVSFKLFSSTSRDDQPGAVVNVGDGLADMTEDDSDLLELPPIVTVLRARGRSHVEVRLQVRITELGALEIWCTEQSAENTSGKWRLSFDMRSGGAANDEEPEEEIDLTEATQLIETIFSGGKSAKLSGIMKGIEKLVGKRRDEWTMTMTRGLFDAALKCETSRSKSADHEARWLTLCGFCLRPGTGAPLDTWRTQQMWRVFNEGLRFEKHEACRLSWWIVWRRIAGGMSEGQQDQLYDRLAQLFLPSSKQKKKWHQLKPSKQEAAEMIRTLANMERLQPSAKIKLGDELIRRLQEDTNPANAPLYFWALGRIGSRVPLYGPLNCVVPAQRAGQWIETMLSLTWPPEKAAFPMAQLGRRTGDRSRDIDEALRDALLARLRDTAGAERSARLVESVVALEAREERVALGDTLPAGLRLAAEPSE